MEVAGAIVWQEYDEHWEAWLDVEDARTLRHHQNLKCVPFVYTLQFNKLIFVVDSKNIWQIFMNNIFNQNL